MRRYLLLFLLLPFLAACEPGTEPGDSNTPSSSTVTVTQLADLPKTGGDVTGIGIAANNSIIAAIDGKLYSMNLSGGAMQLINGDVIHSTLGVAPSGEVYTLTETDFRTYDLVAGTHRDVPIDPAGPLAMSRRIEESEIIFSPSGEPYIKLINNTPQTYVYYSTDKGASWTQLQLPQGFSYGGGIAFAPNGDLLMSSPFGFYRSGDRGATWTTYPVPRSGYGGKLYVASNGDIYHYPPKGGGLKVSKDGGASFTELTPFNNPPFIRHLEQGSDGALYAQTDLYFLRSTDGGANWKTIAFAQGDEFSVRGSVIAVGLKPLPFSQDKRYSGVLISQNSGSTWIATGLNPIEQVTDVGFDKDGNLIVLAENGLYRRTSAGWQTFGISPAFSRFASTPQGGLLLASSTSVFYSGDNGATWKESKIQDYQPSLDPAMPTVVLGRKQGDFLLSLTSYSNTRGHSNGHLYRIGADGVPVRLREALPTLSSMVEDANGLLYGASERLNDFTQTYTVIRYTSNDGGTTWQEQQQQQPLTPFPLAFNSANKYFASNGQGYALFTPGSGAKAEIKLQGFTSQPNYITRALFSPDDRLHLVTLDKGVFISAAPVR